MIDPQHNLPPGTLACDIDPTPRRDPDDDPECPHCGALPHRTNCPDSHCEPDPRNTLPAPEQLACRQCDSARWLSVRCVHCNGSGEGMADGTRCLVCKGHGEIKVACENCNAAAPDDEPDPDRYRDE